jgi:capsular exopolysaccharide synthesis family protein
LEADVGKTFAALKRAEEEKRAWEGTTSITPGPGKFRPSKNSSPAVEEYHRMKYKILSSNHDRAMKAILFCSSGPGEGNSTVLTDFALTLASEGDRVLLVDANLRTPSLHRVFQLERENGLTELALGKSSLEDVMKKAPFDNLWVITSGTPHSNPFSILENRGIDSHVEQMKARADWVLFDSAPANSYMDSIALAGKVDGVVMVLQSEKTRWEVAQFIKERLESGNGNILGVILNKRRFYIPRWLYKTV